MEEKDIKQTEQAQEVKEEESEKKKNRAILLIIGIATVLIALIGATFAFFTAQINNVNGDQSVMVTTATVEGVIYTSTDPIVLNHAMPGDSDEGTFTIENPNTTAKAIYTITFVPDFDNFVTTPTDPTDREEDMVGQLILTVEGPGIVGQFRHDFTDGANATPQPVAVDIEIPANAMGNAGHTYTANIEFVEIDKNQNANKSTDDRSVSFFGHFEVTQKVTSQTSSNP